MIRFVQAQSHHARLIAANMRERDVAELRAGWGASPEHVMRTGLAASYYARTCFFEMEPLAIFGLVPLNILSGAAQVWVVGTRAIDGRSLSFARASRAAVSMLFEHCTLMTNLVDQGDARAMKWMRWLGGAHLGVTHLRGGRAFSQFIVDGRRRACQLA